MLRLLIHIIKLTNLELNVSLVYQTFLNQVKPALTLKFPFDGLVINILEIKCWLVNMIGVKY